MTTRNIFATIDVGGFIEQYRSEITSYYDGVDVTSKYMSEQLENKLLDIKNGQKTLMMMGYWDRTMLPGYTRLVSSKASTIGYKVTRNDYEWIDQTKGELRLNNLYNLMIGVDNGDIIRWWGHSLRPNSHIQAIISDVHKTRPQQGRPSEFTQFSRKNIQFYFADSAVDTENLLDGVQVSTHQSYCMECTINATPGDEISYDIDIMLLSTSINYQGSLISIPIVNLVVDPTIKVNP